MVVNAMYAEQSWMNTMQNMSVARSTALLSAQDARKRKLTAPANN
jgi:hypothetical protein